MKILIIETDPGACEVYRSMLEEINADITMCHTIEQALQVLIYLQPDIVLVDLSLPKAGGEIVLGFIRNHPHLANTQVIVVSSDSQLAMSTASHWAINKWLHKPILKDQLYEVIGAVNS
jgi:DNA-binding response OmpR family regulator